MTNHPKLSAPFLLTAFLAAIMMILPGCTTKTPPPNGEVSGTIIKEERMQNTEGPLTVTVLEPAAPLRAANPAGVYTEIPPLLFDAGGRRYAVISTHFSVMAPLLPDRSPLVDRNAYDVSSAAIIAGSQLEPPPAGARKSPEEVHNYDFYWGRAYYGFYDAAVFTGADGKKYIAAAAHGENKNYIVNGARYVNSVKDIDTVYDSRSYSGSIDGGPWTENWANYFGFASLCIAPLEDPAWKALYTFDIGPVVWPSSGYLSGKAADMTASHGVRHPRLFIDDDYMYLFYLDESSGAFGSGREPGIKAARSPLSALGAPGSWKKYYYDDASASGGFTEDALPAGFAKEDRLFLSQQSGKASTIIAGSGNYSFSAAKINGTGYYLGVYKEETAPNRHAAKLTVSTDLVNWSRGVEVPGTEVQGGWNDFKLQYPLLYNLALDDHFNIDAEGFYIIGSYDHNPANYVKVSVVIAGEK